MKKVLSLLLVMGVLLSLAVPFTVSADTEGDFEYAVWDGEVTITRYTRYDAVVNIPATLGGYPVTRIGDDAFRGNYAIEQITIPEGITTIGSCAFYHCQELKQITIPASATTIAVNALHWCYDLLSVDVDANNPAYCSQDGALFNKDKSVLIQYPAGKKDESYTVPDSVTLIEDSAFALSSLREVIISDGVTTIGYEAFHQCLSLKTVTISNSVTAIDDRAFFGCDSLQTAYYKGTQQDWEQVTVAELNEQLLNVLVCLTETYVVEQIAALPEEITLGDKDAVSAARRAYNALTDEQKALVGNIAVLEAAEARISELENTPVQYGDPNGDGNTSASDALEVLKSVVGKVNLTKEQVMAADVDGNGAVNATDALLILKKVVGKIDKFPVEIA